MGRRRGLRGFAWLCGGGHLRDLQQQPQLEKEAQQQQQQQQQQIHQAQTAVKLRSQLRSPLPPLQHDAKSNKAVAAAADSYCRGAGAGNVCIPGGGRGSSGTRTSSGAEAKSKSACESNAKAVSNEVAAAEAEANVTALSVPEDSDSLSSVPASEAVFGLASRATPPPAPVGAPLKLAAGDMASVDGRSSGGYILRPMASGALPAAASRSHSTKRRSSKNVPNTHLNKAEAGGCGGSGGNQVEPASGAGFDPPASTTASAILSPRSPELNRVPSLSASERSSYSSSLLLAAFDRHDTRRVFLTDSAMGDSASSGSGGSPSPEVAQRGSRTGGDRSGSFTSVRSKSSCVSTPSLALAAATATAAAAAAGQTAVAPGGSGGGAPGALSSEAAALAVAKEFCDAFLLALASGDHRWGSNPRVAVLFSEAARMLTHDGQLFVGRTAIIRRLNAGMEQLNKVLGAMRDGGGGGGGNVREAEGEGAGAEAAVAKDVDVAGGALDKANKDQSLGKLKHLADKVQHSLDIQITSKNTIADAKRHKVKGGILRRFLSMGVAANGGGCTAAAGGASVKSGRSFSRNNSVSSFIGNFGGGNSCNTGAGSASSSIRVVATYHFRFGLRRFRLQDHFAVRDGLIIRLKRTRG